MSFLTGFYQRDFEPRHTTGQAHLSDALFPAGFGYQRNLQGVFQVVDELKGQAFLDVLGDVLEVFFVFPGQDDGLDSGPARADYLFLDAADRHYLAPEINLAGHGDVVADSFIDEERGQGHADGHASRRAVLGCGPGRDVDVDVVTVKGAVRNLEPLGVAPDIAQGGPG